MKRINILGAVMAAAFMLPTTMVAQDKVEATVGADLVSSYIWRGQDLGGMSIQPSLDVSYKGLSLSAWGSVGIERTDTKEFDLTLSYSVGGLTIGVTDYWFAYSGQENKYLHYGAHSTAHVWEANLGYDFGPVNTNWYTNIGGADGTKEDGKRAYSSYILLNAPFKLGGLDWEAEIGATPWETSFYAKASGFAVCDISLKATKELKITETFSLPVFAKIGVNPANEAADFTFGISL